MIDLNSFHLVPPTSSLSYLQLKYCCDTGQTFGGLLEYMKNCNILKIVTHVKFVFSRFEGFSFTHASIMMIFSRMNLGTVVVNPTIGLIRWGQYENTSPCILCIIFTPAIDTSELSGTSLGWEWHDWGFVIFLTSFGHEKILTGDKEMYLSWYSWKPCGGIS